MVVIETDPLVEQVRDRLRKQAGAAYPVGSRLPAMRKLCDDFGCSLGVVQMAVNTLVAEGRLRSEPRRGVFVAEPTSTKRDVVLILPTLKLEAMDAIIRGVRNGLPEKRGLRLSIQAADNTYEHQLDLLEDLDRRTLAGAIICPPVSDSYAGTIQRYIDSGLTIIQATHRLDAVRAETVVVDGFEMGRTAAEHLLAYGHRDIALVGLSDQSRTNRDIRSGVFTTLRNAGVDPESLPQASLDGEANDERRPWASAERAAAELLASGRQITAAMGHGHYSALGVARAAAAAGLSIPCDLSLVAMGVDIEGLRLMPPGITLVENPVEFICQRAATRLVQVLDSPGQPPEVIQLPPRLLERHSVAAAPGSQG